MASDLLPSGVAILGFSDILSGLGMQVRILDPVHIELKEDAPE
jgi:hypothetical protein